MEPKNSLHQDPPWNRRLKFVQCLNGNFPFSAPVVYIQNDLSKKILTSVLLHCLEISRKCTTLLLFVWCLRMNLKLGSIKNNFCSVQNSTLAYACVRKIQCCWYKRRRKKEDSELQTTENKIYPFCLECLNCFLYKLPRLCYVCNCPLHEFLSTKYNVFTTSVWKLTHRVKT